MKAGIIKPLEIKITKEAILHAAVKIVGESGIQKFFRLLHMSDRLGLENISRFAKEEIGNIVETVFHGLVIELKGGNGWRMKYSEFKKDMRDRYCRQCINNKLGIQLVTDDCLYNIYQNSCQCCGIVKNIVADVRWTGKYKIKKGK